MFTVHMPAMDMMLDFEPKEGAHMTTLSEKLKGIDKSERFEHLPVLSPSEVEQLLQLRIMTWDGNLISKTARGVLVKLGLAVRWNGYQVITQDGLAVLDSLGLIRTPREAQGNLFRE